MFALIEELPDAVSLQCLARVPFTFHPQLQLVCRAWRSALCSVELFKAHDEGSSLFLVEVVMTLIQEQVIMEEFLQLMRCGHMILYAESGLDEHQCWLLVQCFLVLYWIRVLLLQVSSPILKNLFPMQKYMIQSEIHGNL